MSQHPLLAAGCAARNPHHGSAGGSHVGCETQGQTPVTDRTDSSAINPLAWPTACDTIATPSWQCFGACSTLSVRQVLRLTTRRQTMTHSLSRRAEPATTGNAWLLPTTGTAVVPRHATSPPPRPRNSPSSHVTTATIVSYM
jgi:hypothetical protein